MNDKLKYRGRHVSDADIDFIGTLIDANPEASRRQLSIKLCEAWNWVQSNGQLRDMVCRSLMLELDRANLIKLPEARFRAVNNAIRHHSADLVAYDSTPLSTQLRELKPLEFTQVRRTRYEKLFDALIQAHHYLGYARPVGEHLKYLISAKSKPIACLLWSSAPRHLGPRDRFIGWSAQARRQNIRFIAYNNRFLILPWVKVQYLASYVLSNILKTLSDDWKRFYSHPVYYAESFIDPERFRGTCYRAANWYFLGKTKGLGKDAKTTKPNRSLKNVLGYPLTSDFRDKLCDEDFGNHSLRFETNIEENVFITNCKYAEEV
ncbi:MAG: DUF4338 domain-containing protein [Candidatus Brocadiales bacterium]|nr:DUF4338 domain-containing protein [Candidatus Brocadiales bacterium]